MSSLFSRFFSGSNRTPQDTSIEDPTNPSIDEVSRVMSRFGDALAEGIADRPESPTEEGRASTRTDASRFATVNPSANNAPVASGSSPTTGRGSSSEDKPVLYHDFNDNKFKPYTGESALFLGTPVTQEYATAVQQAQRDAAARATLRGGSSSEPS